MNKLNQQNLKKHFLIFMIKHCSNFIDLGSLLHIVISGNSTKRYDIRLFYTKVSFSIFLII